MGSSQHVQQLLGNGQDTSKGQPAAIGFPEAFQRHAMEQLHDQKCRAVVGDVVVDDRDRTFVLDAIRDIALPDEALADERIERQLPMQHLEGEALAVAVLDGVYHRHTATSHHVLHDVLAVDGPPQPSRGKLRVVRQLFHVHWGATKVPENRGA